MKVACVFLLMLVVFVLSSACGGDNGGSGDYGRLDGAAAPSDGDYYEKAEPLDYYEGGAGSEYIEGGAGSEYIAPLPPSTGRIFLFGEMHGFADIMDRQLEIWGELYHDYGMRHLFLEAPYFTAQFLNLWMQADDDEILYQLFEDWYGTSKNTPHTLVFYRTIKRDFPETVFHGTDVGHQSDSTGRRFLRHLMDSDQFGTEYYRLTRENMAQFTRFQMEGSHAVRAYYKPQNFAREFDRLIDQDIMAIHGGAHVNFEDFLGYEGVPTMATTLRLRYGDALMTFDMSHYAAPVREPYGVDIISVGGIDFEASYFGNDGMRFSDIIGREFWRLEGAYEYFRDSEPNGDVLPFSNFPVRVEIGQVFIVDIHRVGGIVERSYFRASGEYWNGLKTTTGFTP